MSAYEHTVDPLHNLAVTEGLSSYTAEAAEPPKYLAGCRQIGGTTTWVIYCPLCSTIEDDGMRWLARWEAQKWRLVEYKSKKSALRALRSHAADDHDPKLMGELL